MKKVLLTALIVVSLLALMAGTAMADEWWQISPGGVLGQNRASTATVDPPKWTVWSSVFSGDADAVGTADYWGMNPSSHTGASTKNDGWGAYAQTSLQRANPHGGFSTSTNYCKVCHAVHDAGANSYRLLKDGGSLTPATGESAINDAGSERDNECMYCHNANSGATSARPYALGLITTVRGEHTIGATYIPDSLQSTDVAGIEPVNGGGSRVLPDGRSSMLSNRDPENRSAATGGILGCYDCHSVHGANTLSVWAPENILRMDPSNDGLTATNNNRPGFAAAGGANQERNNYCADCHNKNASWDTDMSDQTRPNPYGGRSHVTGPAANGQLEVYGTTMTVAVPSATGTADITTRGCRGCHNSDDAGTWIFKNATYTVSAWPHQTIESKMLLRSNGNTADGSSQGTDGYDGEASGYDRNGQAGDSYRALYSMDKVCLRCHTQDGTGGGTWGVGVTF